MPNRNAKHRSARTIKMIANAGKSQQAANDLPPAKAPQRTTGQAAGLRASINRGGKSRAGG